MKKFVSAAVSAVSFGFIAICAAVMYSVPVNAYIDPSVQTLIIQSIAGVAVAVGAVFAVVWRKAKKKAAKVFHVDENAGKETEDDLVEFDNNGESNDNK